MKRFGLILNNVEVSPQRFFAESCVYSPVERCGRYAKEKPEFKQLSKKYLSLVEDLDEFKKVVAVIPLGNNKENEDRERIKNLKRSNYVCEYY